MGGKPYQRRSVAPFLVSSGVTTGVEGLCCTNGVRDSLFESSMVAGGYEQLGPYEVQDHELVDLQ